MEDKKEKPIFSENLVKYRKLNKLTQLELAEKLNYSDKAVSKWERGESIPEISVISKVAEIFDITVGELIGEEPKTSVELEAQEEVILSPKDIKAKKVADEKAKKAEAKAIKREKALSAKKNRKPISKKAKIIITILSSLGAWAIAAIVFFILEVVNVSSFDTVVSFLFAIPVTFVVTTVFACVWSNEKTMFISTSALIISLLFIFKFFLGSTVFKALIPVAIIAEVAFALGFYLLSLRHTPKIKIEEKSTETKE